MKTKKKILMALAIACCAILLVVGSVAATVAYLTSTDTVTNTFTVGNVAITLDEADVDVDGEKIEGAARVKENEYKLIPNHTYTKDPTIHVADSSEDCYIFFEVVNGLGEDATLNIDAANWTRIGTSNVYYYKEVATAGHDYVVFTQFTVSGTAEVANYADAEIVVTAYAVQADGFTTAEAAWTATFGAPANP